MKTWIGIDLGGTNLTGGLVTEDFKIRRKRTVPTCQNWTARQLMDEMEKICREFMDGEEVGEPQAVGIGVPGTANQTTGCLEYANNLAAGDMNIPKEMEKRLGIPAAFENDGNAAAWAEFCLGSGRGTKNFLLLTLGTGVGGGSIINGRLLRGVNDAAGEFGHMVIHPDGRLCTCGRRGCFEMYGSATGLLQNARDLQERYPASPLFADEGAWNGRRLLEEAKKGDSCAAEALERYVRDLAQGITDLINLFQPEVLALGGGIGDGSHGFLEPLRALVSEEVYSRKSREQTQVVRAQLGGDAGIIGAAMIAGLCPEDVAYAARRRGRILSGRLLS